MGLWHQVLVRNKFCAMELTLHCRQTRGGEVNLNELNSICQSRLGAVLCLAYQLLVVNGECLQQEMNRT